MTTAFARTSRVGRGDGKQLSALQAETPHDRLLAAMGEWTARYAGTRRDSPCSPTEPADDPTGLDRAIAALGMYGAIEAIEKIEDALVGERTDAVPPPLNALDVVRVAHDPASSPRARPGIRRRSVTNLRPDEQSPLPREDPTKMPAS